MKFSRIIQKITSTAVSLAMLSSLMVCAVPTVSAQQTDVKTSESSNRFAHNIYGLPDASQTSGSFLSFMIDFKTDHQANATYWQLCQANLDVSEIKQTYPNASNGTFYGGFQHGPARSNTLFSFWDIINNNDEKQILTTPTRIYPDGGENTFGSEGNGNNYAMDYDWKANKWYTMLYHCWKDETTGKTFIGQWVRDVETGEWTLTCYFNTTMSETCIQGDMWQFLENFVTTYAEEKRDIYFKNIYVYDKIQKQWVSLNRSTISYSYNHDNKMGKHDMVIADDYFYGRTGETVDNQTEYDNSTPKFITGEITQPDKPNFGAFAVDSLSVDDKNKLSWTFTQNSSPLESLSIDVLDTKSMTTVQSYVCTRPETSEIELNTLPDGRYIVRTKFRDVFYRNTYCDFELSVSGGKSSGQRRSFPMGDFTDDGTVALIDVIGILRENLSPTPTTDKYRKFLGDVNKDGVVSLKDAVLIQRWLLDETTTADYPVGDRITIFPLKTPTVFPKYQDSKTNRVKFTDTKNWGNIYIYAWNSSSQESNAAWPGVAMKSSATNSYGQRMYTAELERKYDMIIFTTSTGSYQTRDIDLDTEAHNYWVTDNTTTNQYGKVVYIEAKS